MTVRHARSCTRGLGLAAFFAVALAVMVKGMYAFYKWVPALWWPSAEEALVAAFESAIRPLLLALLVNAGLSFHAWLRSRRASSQERGKKKRRMKRRKLSLVE